MTDQILHFVGAHVRGLVSASWLGFDPLDQQVGLAILLLTTTTPSEIES